MVKSLDPEVFKPVLTFVLDHILSEIIEIEHTKRYSLVKPTIMPYKCTAIRRLHQMHICLHYYIYLTNKSDYSQPCLSQDIHLKLNVLIIKSLQLINSDSNLKLNISIRYYIPTSIQSYLKYVFIPSYQRSHTAGHSCTPDDNHHNLHVQCAGPKTSSSSSPT